MLELAHKATHEGKVAAENTAGHGLRCYKASQLYGTNLVNRPGR